MVLKTLAADYKSFFELHKVDASARPPNFKGAKWFTTMCHNQSGFKLTKNGTIALTQFYSKDVSLEFEIPKHITNELFGHKLYQVNIYAKDDKFFVSVIYEEIPKEHKDTGKYLAIDQGVTKLVTAVNSSGKFFEVKNPRPDKYWNPIVDSIKSRRDHCKPYSRKRERLHNKYRECERKRSNANIDLEHKTARRIVDNTKADTIIIGDLDVKKMAQPKPDKKLKHGLNRSTQSTGYLSRFARFLTYKAELVGKKVIEIDESYTTKQCYACGKMHDMPTHVRTMKCDCGNVIDRDRNSAINIMVRFLSQYAQWTSYRQFADNLRKTGLREIREVYSQEAPRSKRISV